MTLSLSEEERRTLGGETGAGKQMCIGGSHRPGPGQRLMATCLV